MRIEDTELNNPTLNTVSMNYDKKYGSAELDIVFNDNNSFFKSKITLTQPVIDGLELFLKSSFIPESNA